MKRGKISPDSAKVVSMCCGAPVYVAGDMTCYYCCLACNSPCDAVPAKPEPEPEDEE